MTTPIESEAPEPVPGNYPRLMWDADGIEFTVYAPSEFTAATDEGAAEAPPEPPEINPEESVPDEEVPEDVAHDAPRTTWRRSHHKRK
jgi:hypothetical protein